MSESIPVVLFAYARPLHLTKALACLRENGVPLIYVFADGAKGPVDSPNVAKTRALLRTVDWADLRLVERTENFGLGQNVLAGVTEIAAMHDSFIIWEDDLVCAPGTYKWMCGALRHYEAESRVMSVTAWTHPRVTPEDVSGRPYCDARAECWVWGAWRRSWRGMLDETAVQKMRAATALGIPGDTYGCDLPLMAESEQREKIWAVRWLYHHLQHGGLCVRPPWSLVEHDGFDASATNAAGAGEWANPSPLRAPPVQTVWPQPLEHPRCRELWRAAYPPVPFARQRRWLRRFLSNALTFQPAWPRRP